MTASNTSSYHEAVQSPSPAKLQFTVAICTRNRSSELIRTLDAIEQQRASLPWEILVIDNNSTDGTRTLLEQRAERSPVPLRVEHEERLGLSFGRNRSLDAARGSTILFVDDDAVPREGWLEAHVRAFADADVVGTGGRIFPVLPQNTPSWYKRIVAVQNGGPTSRYDFGEISGDITEENDRLFPFGANMGLRRDIAREAGGFRTDLGWGAAWMPGEETDLMLRLWRRGGRLRYVPDAVVDHHILESRVTWDYYQHWQRGLGRALVRMSPPRSRLERWRQVVTSTWKIAHWQLRASRRSFRRLPDEVYQARLKVRLHQGRLGELVIGKEPAVQDAPLSSDF